MRAIIVLRFTNEQAMDDLITFLDKSIIVSLTMT